MATINVVGVALSGSTGTVHFVGSNSPTLVTPVLGTPASGNLVNCTNVASSAKVTEQQFTSGSGTYTPGTGAQYIWVRAVGGGGQGGGCTSAAAANAGAGGGGGSGGYAEYIAAAASYAYSVGSGGSGASAGSSGNAGHSTTFGTAGAKISVGGGGGGGHTNSSTGNSSNCFFVAGGSNGTSTTGTVTILGNAGLNASVKVTTNYGAAGGLGASSPFGIGGDGGYIFATGTNSNGIAPTGYGSGGGGGVCWGASGTATGAAGASGVIIVTEYY